MYNYYRQGWVVGRLNAMAEEVFGAEPVVLSVPFQESIAASDSQAMHLTVILAGGPGNETLDGLRRAMGGGRFFWAHAAPEFNRSVNAYGPAPPSSRVPIRRTGRRSARRRSTWPESDGRRTTTGPSFIFASPPSPC